MATRTATKTKTASDWKSNRRHSVTLPSGFECEIEIPNLPVLVKTGQLPNALVTEALGTIQAGKLTAEAIAEQAIFYAKLVVATVKSPELTEDDVIGADPIPFEDIEMIAELATRQRDLDAVGNHIGGLHTSKTWRTFRGLDHLDADVEGA
jgi:hypothetical protein